MHRLRILFLRFYPPPDSFLSILLFRGPKIKARLADMGATPLAGSSANFGKLIADETEKWGKVIRAAGIKAE